VSGTAGIPAVHGGEEVKSRADPSIRVVCAVMALWYTEGASAG